MPEQEHQFPILTIDPVVFQLVNDKLAVLLIKRGFEPHKNELALPGAYVSKDETTREAFKRVLKDKTAIDPSQINIVEQPYAFDMPSRDPRGYAVTVMYVGLGKNLVFGDAGSARLLQEPQFVAVSELPRLAYDHNNIVAFAVNRLKELAMNTNVVAGLLASQFTLLQLQTAYEAILGAKLDKRNFRKKVLQHQLVKTTNKVEKDAAHRPAELYEFCKNTTNIFA